MPDYPHHLRFRQVHLDFHTSEAIPGIGKRFNKRRFQAALRVGHVDSITLFSKCHHGWSYHPTKVGRRHPHLKIDLLSRQIDACREIGVRCPIYLSAGVDEWMAREHPEWLVKSRQGLSYDPLQVGWFKRLRFDSPYLDYLCAQIEEVVQRWPDNDGIFLDIIGPQHDYSEPALRAMKSLGLDPSKDADVADYAQRVLRDYYRRTNAASRSVRSDTPIFHNGGHVPVGARRFNLANSHFELESLPTYAATQPRDYLGMTGKFHTTWGEFGGFKRPAALRYECAAMLAYGAKCSIGDQLHPDGAMNLDTYRLIGDAYAEVEAKEPWCDHVQPVARIGLVSAEAHQTLARGHTSTSAADEGAARMLLELHLPFVVLDAEARWTGYELIVLPDTTALTAASIRKLRAHLAKGGKVLAAGSALLDPSTGDFAVDPGAKAMGRSPFDPDYVVATELCPQVPVRSPIVIHGGAVALQLTTGRELVGRRDSYFNRTWEHFCSHQHAPDAPGAASPAAVLGERIAYFAHDIFTRYRAYGQPLYRDFVAAALDHLFEQQLPVTTTLPCDGRINVLEQRAAGRYVVHLLYAPKSVRGGTRQSAPLEVIEDLIPLRDVSFTLRLPRRAKTARLVPAGIELEVTATESGAQTVTVPEFTGHAMIELAYR